MSLSSLAAQTYRHFEVILLGAMPPPDVVRLFSDTLGCVGHLALAVKAVLSDAGRENYLGDFVILLVAGDRLEPWALQRLSALVSEKAGIDLDLVTFDYVWERGRRRMYLPGWDPELLEYLDYIRTAFCLSPSLISKLTDKGPFVDVLSFLRCAARDDLSSAHLGEVLLNVAQPAGAPLPIDRADTRHPPMSIVIPNRNGIDLLPKCVASLSDLNAPLDLVIVDNASDDPRIRDFYGELEQRFAARIVPFNHPFNYARMINIGVEAARHEYVLLLNNDVFIADAVAAIAAAMSFAIRPEIGVVGSVLRYPDGRVQHAGMALRRDTAGNCEVDHILRFAVDDEGDYLGALTAPRNWQSVTGAFQLVRKAVFQEVGGYDEAGLPVEHNDVDFCLKVRKSGRRVVCLPLPGIVHDESYTRRHVRKAEASQMRRRARELMAARWPGEFQVDPFVHHDLRAKAKGARKAKSIGQRVSRKVKSLRRRLAGSKPGPTPDSSQA